MASKSIDPLVGDRRQQIGDATTPRNDEVGRELGQRTQNESAFVEPRMRHLQLGQRQLEIAVQEQVEIERSGRVRDRALASVGGLDGLQFMQQRER